MNDEIELKDIQLSMYNPRFTVMDRETKLMDLIVKDMDNYNEEEAIKKLFKYEGDYSDLSSLLDSIKGQGFRTDIDRIVFVEKKDKYNKSKYVVAEGNRRIAILKILSNYNDFNSLIEENEDIDDDSNDDNDNKSKKSKTNINKINKLLSQLNDYKDYHFSKEQIKDINILEYSNDDDEQKLRSYILQKHTSGQFIGKRNWHRGQYFRNILDWFKNGITNDNQNEVMKNFGKKFDSFISDFEQAQFVRDVFKYKQYCSSESKLNEDWKEDIRKGRVSSLQTQFSIKKIEDVVEKTNTLKPFNSYFKWSYDDKHLIRYEGKISERIFELIYFCWKEGWITTRDIKREDRPEFERVVLYFMQNTKLLINEEYNEEYLKKLNIWEILNWPLKYRKKFLENSNVVKFLGDKSSSFIKDLNDLETNIDKASKYFLISEGKEDKFNKTTEHLYKQWKHNTNPTTTYIHAVAATIRSLKELMTILIIDSNDDLIDNIMQNRGIGKQERLDKWRKCVIPGEYNIKSDDVRINSIMCDARQEKFKNELKEYIINSFPEEKANVDILIKFLLEDEDFKNLSEIIHKSHIWQNEGIKKAKLIFSKFNENQEQVVQIVKHIMNKEKEVKIIN